MKNQKLNSTYWKTKHSWDGPYVGRFLTCAKCGKRYANPEAKGPCPGGEKTK